MPEISEFAGLNNVARRPERSGPGDLQVATNVLVTDVGSLMRRDGSSVEYAGAVHSLNGESGSLLFVEGSSLKRYDGSGQATVLRSGLTPDRDMTYFWLDDRLYFTNGVDTGVIQGGAARSWGLQNPPPPNVAPISGEMVPGTYQVALTYIRTDGQESGASTPVPCIADEGGISVTNVMASADPDVAAIAVYVSPVGGEVLENGAGLYRQAVLPNADTSFRLRGGGIASGVECQTLNLYPPPAGEALAFYRGRLFIGSGPTLYYTPMHRYELVALDWGRVPLSSPITNVLPVENGIWLTTKKQCMFLAGKNPEADGGFDVKSVINHGAARGGKLVDSRALGLRGLTPGQQAVFVTSDGVYVGDGIGAFVGVTGSRWVPPAVDGRCGLIDRIQGADQFVFGLLGDVGVGQMTAGVEQGTWGSGTTS